MDLMNIEEFRAYCIRKKGATEAFPFDEDVLVFKVMNKMFALTSLSRWEQGDQSINLKCDPDRAQELRAQYDSVQPGYHMSKTHWNTVHINNPELTPSLVKELIDHSYDLVVAKLPRKSRHKLEQ